MKRLLAEALHFGFTIRTGKDLLLLLLCKLREREDWRRFHHFVTTNKILYVIKLMCSTQMSKLSVLAQCGVHLVFFLQVFQSLPNQQHSQVNWSPVSPDPD